MAHILFVDDDLELQALVSELLELEGFETSVCSDGIECLEFLQHTTPDIIILDVMMPRKNGWDTLKDLRIDSPHIPVIMLSAKGDSIDRVLGLELGADDYISKPFDDRELIARIRARMRIVEAMNQVDESEDDSVNLIEIDGLSLNRSQLQTRFKGKLINLTSTEFSLLFYMAEHRGETLSRDDLSREVLGKRHQAFDRVIDMHLSNLRKKLPKRDSGLPWFKTIHGLGYMFLDEA